jgi:hypothetical protein
VLGKDIGLPSPHLQRGVGVRVRQMICAGILTWSLGPVEIRYGLVKKGRGGVSPRPPPEISQGPRLRRARDNDHIQGNGCCLRPDGDRSEAYAQDHSGIRTLNYSSGTADSQPAHWGGRNILHDGSGPRHSASCPQAPGLQIANSPRDFPLPRRPYDIRKSRRRGLS